MSGLQNKQQWVAVEFSMLAENQQKLNNVKLQQETTICENC